MCKKELEGVTHVFLTYQFAHSILAGVLEISYNFVTWDTTSIEEYLKRWISIDKSYHTLPFYIFYGIW